MFILVFGGSASGKSGFAEKLCMEFGDKYMYYLAAMEPFGAEAAMHIERHRRMRDKKGFETIERYHDLEKIKLPHRGTVLLECVSNLLANEMFSGRVNKEKLCEKIICGVEKLIDSSNNMVVVTNDVFCDGIIYGNETMEYMRILGDINYRLTALADEAVEVILSQPVYYKKR
ncbi:bifunctional adenosylcobinamide kinase/adenosylcobinamide-phosphate guanylyltransferase [Lachnospiraceae bacterium NSJ-143]|nr:bifunctional adenosylcobinamide kinase/adenosylcobinamide-phosphate guanylyltransferase [Lachnospiraceae bacterium NSJ-143]